MSPRLKHFNLSGFDCVVQVVEELDKLGVDGEAINKILSSMAVKSLEELETLIGTDTEAIADMRYLFNLAEGYSLRHITATYHPGLGTHTHTHGVCHHCILKLKTV
jgi:histidyl-tRNA synthetase